MDVAANIALIEQLERTYALLGLDAPEGAAECWTRQQIVNYFESDGDDFPALTHPSKKSDPPDVHEMLLPAIRRLEQRNSSEENLLTDVRICWECALTRRQCRSQVLPLLVRVVETISEQLYPKLLQLSLSALIFLSFSASGVEVVKTDSGDSSDAVKTDGGGTSEAVVLVLGWAGSDIEALEPVVRGHFEQQLADIVTAITEIAAAKASRELPVLVHCFSNNGWLFYVRLLQYLAMHHSGAGGFCIRGVIMDSAPETVYSGPLMSRVALNSVASAVRHAEGGSSRFLPSATLRRRVSGLVESPAGVALFDCCALVARWLLAHEPRSAPLLLMHSRMDRIITKEAVQRYAATVRAQQPERHVQEHMFQLGQHIAPFFLFRAEYCSILEPFVKKCLQPLPPTPPPTNPSLPPRERMLAASVWCVVGQTTRAGHIASRLGPHLQARGRDVYCVNPRLAAAEAAAQVAAAGGRLQQKLADFAPAVKANIEAINLCIHPALGEQIMREAAALGIKLVWIQPGASSPEVLRACTEGGIAVYEGCTLVEI